jgi:hypothetical protein
VWASLSPVDMNQPRRRPHLHEPDHFYLARIDEGAQWLHALTDLSQSTENLVILMVTVPVGVPSGFRATLTP